MTEDNNNDKPREKQDGDLIEVISYDEITGKNYVPEGFDSVEDFLLDMREQYNADVKFDFTNREAALDDKKFAAGEQWDEQVLIQRKGLPCLVINSIPQFTAQVVGDWREARRAVKVVASTEEDTDVASVRGDIIRAIEMQSRADRVYDSSFESLVQCGDGAYRIAVEYARDNVFDQNIRIRPIEDALAVVWDRYSVDPTGRDARRVFVDDRIPKKEFCRKYPGIDPTELQYQPMMQNLAESQWEDSDSYRITEYWRLVERKKILGLFSNGKVFEVTEENLLNLVNQYGAPVKTRESWVSYAQMHLCTAFAILSGPYEYQLNRLPIIRMSGRVVNIGGRRVRHGLVRFMKDPVRLKNFWRSVAAEQLGYAPKAQWIATESAVEGREEVFRNAHLTRDPLIIVNDEAEIGRNIQRLDPPVPQAALLNEANVNAQDMKDVTGIQDASLGIKSNETSGRAIMARQREGDIATLTFHDNGNAAILEGGDVINQLIPQVMDGTRIVLTIGEDEAVKFQKINDPYDPDAVDMSVGMFDVALSTGTSYTTRRVEAAQSMMDAIQVWPQLMGIAGDLVVKAQEWPGAEKLAERLKKTIPPQFLEEGEEGGLGVTPEQLQEMQMTIQQLQTQLQTMEMDRSLEMQKLEIDEYNAKTQRIRALSDHEVDNQQQSLEAIKVIIDSSKAIDEQDIRKEELLMKDAQHTSSLAAKSTADSKKKTQSGSANG